MGSSAISTVTSSALAARLQQLNTKVLQREFEEHGAFLYLKDFLPAQITTELVGAASACVDSGNRNYLPGHKQAGSVSPHPTDPTPPSIAEFPPPPTFTPYLAS